MTKKPLYIYIDVDETFVHLLLVKGYGKKRISIPAVIEHIKQLKEQGATLYCWSLGSAEYAQKRKRCSTKELDIHHCFASFLPKPEVLIDDLKLENWHPLLEVHPNECSEYTLESCINKTWKKT